MKCLNKGCSGSFEIATSRVEEEAEDLVRYYQSALKRRRRGSVISIWFASDTPAALRGYVARELHVHDRDVILAEGLLGLSDIDVIYGKGSATLKFPAYLPRFPERIRDTGGDCFAAIRQKDIIVHHPYESFERGRSVRGAGRPRRRRRCRSSRHSTGRRTTARS